MSNILAVTSDPDQSETIRRVIGPEDHTIILADDEPSALAVLTSERVDLVILDLTRQADDDLEFLRELRRHRPGLRCVILLSQSPKERAVEALREHVCDFLITPFTEAELHASVRDAITTCAAAQVEVLSALPDWVELCVPCDLGAIPLLEKALLEIETRLPEELRHTIAYAFREMLNNAVEYGCSLDRSQHVKVSYVRLQRAIVCWIKDPGPGFDPDRLRHAAIKNPTGDPIRHLSIRNELGLRPGGFGILMTSQMVDELVFNERHNELMFIKYLN